MFPYSVRPYIIQDCAFCAWQDLSPWFPGTVLIGDIVFLLVLLTLRLTCGTAPRGACTGASIACMEMHHVPDDDTRSGIIELSDSWKSFKEKTSLVQTGAVRAFVCSQTYAWSLIYHNSYTP